MSGFRIRLDFHPSPPPSFLSPCSSGDEEEEEEEEEDDDEEEEEEEEEEEVCASRSEWDPISSPFIVSQEKGCEGKACRRRHNISISDILVDLLRKSLVTCSVDPDEDVCQAIEIGSPTDVRHVSHVTFDRFSGFLGLPGELEPHLPRRVPSASSSVFGVSAESMQCSFDDRGNSLPTILLLMQRHLYSHGGLQAEGIFRINSENSKEAYVRDQLNKGVVPHGVDLHCLAGLIKAWFRELPMGILDSLTSDQVMHCNTEEECSQLVSMLAPTEAALLDWVINLMADVVLHEHYNKMNARNIAMVFAPNMTQMADPLTALVHAVQVMNFLKTLIIQTIRKREEAAKELMVFTTCSQIFDDKDDAKQPKSAVTSKVECNEKASNAYNSEGLFFGEFVLSREHGAEHNANGSFDCSEKKFEDAELAVENSLPTNRCQHAVEDEYARIECSRGDETTSNRRLRFRKGMRRLCRNRVSV